MAGLVSAIHVFVSSGFKTWMPATSAGMTHHALESDNVEAAGEALAERVGKLALRGDILRRFEAEDSRGGHDPRHNVAQQIDAKHDVQRENETEIPDHGGGRQPNASPDQRRQARRVAETNHKADTRRQIEREEKHDENEPAD